MNKIWILTPDSKAFGKENNSAVAKRKPVDRPNIFSIIFDKKLKEKKAAIEILIIPLIIILSKI